MSPRLMPLIKARASPMPSARGRNEDLEASVTCTYPCVVFGWGGTTLAVSHGVVAVRHFLEPAKLSRELARTVGRINTKRCRKPVAPDNLFSRSRSPEATD
jgi:hypothetical protein